MEAVLSRWPLFLMLLVILASCLTFVALALKKYRVEKEENLKAGNASFRRPEGKFSIVAQFCAVLDENTCPLCRSLDGKIIELGHPDYGSFTPPLHPVLPGRTHTSCRCYWTYLSKNDEPAPWVNWGRPSRDLLVKFFAKDSWEPPTTPDWKARR
jgi:hypothetical protein